MKIGREIYQLLDLDCIRCIYFKANENAAYSLYSSQMMIADVT
jgi:hypothetical protein